MLGSRTGRRTRTSRLAVLTVASLVGCLLTSSPASAATGSIAGVVTGPGGVPLQGVEVDVYSQPGNNAFADVTDATGAYEVQGLPAGDFKVLFGYANANSAFTQEFYDDAFDETSADVVSVPDGATITGIDAELAVGAKVTGRLTTASGVGVHDGHVGASRLAVDGLHPPYYGTAVTDSDGYYVVQGLPPGTYRLSFYDNTQGVGEFWNDKAGFDAGDDVVLTVGQVRTGIDAVLGTPPPPLPAVVNLQLPIVAGGKAPQVGYPVSATRGYWTPGGAAVTHQWLLDGQPIPGAIGTTYTPTLAQLGRSLAVRSTASLAGFQSATATSLPTAPVSKQVQNTKRPWLKGTAKVGERLRVKVGRWWPYAVVTYRYRWYADGDRIRGAREERLRLTSAMKGTKIVCRVTGSAPGLDRLHVLTLPSPKVKR